MDEMKWIKEFEKELKTKEEIPCDWELYCWENISKLAMQAKIKELKKRAKSEEQAFAAANCLGDLYYLGCKVHKISVNFTKAILWFRQAAQYSNAHRGEVLYKLAYCYKNGRGKNKDKLKAFKMFEALAKIDDSRLPVSAEFTKAANAEFIKMSEERKYD